MTRRDLLRVGVLSPIIAREAPALIVATFRPPRTADVPTSESKLLDPILELATGRLRGLRLTCRTRRWTLRDDSGGLSIECRPLGDTSAMPLIECPECGGSVSSFAASCPRCGLPSMHFGLDSLRPVCASPTPSSPATLMAHVFGVVGGTEGWDGMDYEELWIAPPVAERGRFHPLRSPQGDAGCEFTVSVLRPNDDFYDDDEVEYYFPRADPCPRCERVLSLWRQTKTLGRVGWWTESGDPVGKADDWSNEEDLEVTPPARIEAAIEVDPETARVREQRRQKIEEDLAKNEWILRRDQ